MDTIELGTQNLLLDDTKGRLIELNGLADKFGTAMTRAFAGGIAHGKGLDDILKGLGQKFIDIGESNRMTLRFTKPEVATGANAKLAHLGRHPIDSGNHPGIGPVVSQFVGNGDARITLLRALLENLVDAIRQVRKQIHDD